MSTTERDLWSSAIVVVIFAAIVGLAGWGLSSAGGVEDPTAGGGRRAAGGSPPEVPITLDNQSSHTVFLSARNVVGDAWQMPRPDARPPGGLDGVYVDPGQTYSVTLSGDELWWERKQSEAVFTLGSTPMVGQSRGASFALYPQTTNFACVSSGQGGCIRIFSTWVWPTATGPDGHTDDSSGCSSTWSGPAGTYQLRDGTTGSITATVSCKDTSRDTADTVTTITFTDTPS